MRRLELSEVAELKEAIEKEK